MIPANFLPPESFPSVFTHVYATKRTAQYKVFLYKCGKLTKVEHSEIKGQEPVSSRHILSIYFFPQIRFYYFIWAFPSPVPEQLFCTDFQPMIYNFITFFSCTYYAKKEQEKIQSIFGDTQGILAT